MYDRMDTEHLDKLGFRLKLLRNNLDLTQTELSKKVGVIQYTFSNYENSKRFPDTRFLFQLRSLFKVNLNWLVNGKGQLFIEQNIKESKQIAELSAKLEALLKDNRY